MGAEEDKVRRVVYLTPGLGAYRARVNFPLPLISIETQRETHKKTKAVQC